MSSLVFARLAHAWRRWTPVALGLAVAVAIPILVAAVGSATAVSALRRQLADLPPGERSVTVSYNGIIDAAELARLDGLVREAVPRISAPTVRRQMLFRQLAEGGGAGAGAFVLAGADDLAGAVRLVSGRLPASCTPTRCEVVELGGPAVVPPAGLGLIVVGQAERTDPLLLSGTFDPGPGVPILIGDGVERVSALAALSSFGRSTGWVSALDADRVRAIGLDAWVRAGAQVARDLWRDGEGLVVTAPVDVVREQDRRARLSTQRFGLLGSSMAVLLLATAVVGGASLRHDHAAFLTALRLRGARRDQVGSLAIVEVAAVTVAGGVLGAVLGAAGVAVIAARSALSYGVTLAEALRSAAPLGLGLLLASGALVGLTLRGRPMWSAVGGGALTAALGAVLLAVRGGVGTAGGGDPLLTLLPALVLAATALGAARIWPALARLGARTLPRQALAARLGLGAVAGRPLRPAATAALLTAAVAAATFAASYRATLDTGAADQAAYAVPLDARLVVGRPGQRPQDAADPATLRAVTGGRSGAVVPVVRAAASVRVDAEQGAPVQAEAVHEFGGQVLGVGRAAAVAEEVDGAPLAEGLEPHLGDLRQHLGVVLEKLLLQAGVLVEDPDDAVGMPGATDGGVVTDEALAVEVVKAVVHEHHAFLAPGLEQVLQLVNLVFPDEIAHGAIRDQQFIGKDPARSIRGREEVL